MSEPPVVPWRAGNRPGEHPEQLTRLAIDEASSPSVYLADVSEFQPDISDPAYLKWSKAIVIRAAYGAAEDAAWFKGARRAALHKAGIRFLGIYQYVVAGEDVLAQADALCEIVGRLEPGEKLIADFEEGAGDQHARWEAWSTRVARLGNVPWDYSGLFFAAEHGLQPVNWIAAYQSKEPAVKHDLWQFTDSFSVPGIPGTCDCSVFHGTIEQLAAHAYQPPKPVPPKPVQEKHMPAGVIAGSLAAYPISFEVGSVKKIAFYAHTPAAVTVSIAHGGGGTAPGTVFLAGTFEVHTRAEYIIQNPEDVDAIILTEITGPVGWHTE